MLVRAQLAGFDRTLEEAALDLGARPWAVLARITLPGIRPALISGWLLAFTLSLDDLVVASFVTGPSATTLPMAVFSSVRLGVSPEVNALATLFLGVVFVLVAAGLLADGAAAATAKPEQLILAVKLAVMAENAVLVERDAAVGGEIGGDARARGNSAMQRDEARVMRFERRHSRSEMRSAARPRSETARDRDRSAWCR